MQILNTVFFKIAAEYTNCDPVSDNINDPIIESVLKKRDHPKGIVIGEVWNMQEELFFTFSRVDKEQMLKEILSLDSARAKDTDFSRNIIKENDIFLDFFLSGLNHSTKTSTFLLSLKKATLIPVFKKGSKSLKKNLRLFPASLDKDVFHFRLQKTSSRRFEDVLPRRVQDV